MPERERHRIILGGIQEKPVITVQDIAELTEASEATIRRDIASLHVQGKLRRVRGGAEAVHPPQLGNLAARPLRVSESVNIEFENEITADQARDILREAPGCLVIDKHENGGYITPIECAGEDATFISRIREDATVENGLNMWIVSDNLRKGAALNAVQIGELLINRGLIKAKKAA